MKKQKPNMLTGKELNSAFESLSKYLSVHQVVLERRTHIFYLIIGTIIGCGLTLIGIGIGLWTGVL